MATWVLDSQDRAAALYRFLMANWRRHAERGAPLVVTVEPPHTNRTVEQNRRYWALLTAIAEIPVDGRRYTNEVWHEHFKRELLGYEYQRMPDGKRRRVPRSTARLSVKKFAEYMERIQAFAAQEFGMEF